jgi:hypothetical protein
VISEKVFVGHLPFLRITVGSSVQMKPVDAEPRKVECSDFWLLSLKCVSKEARPSATFLSLP